MAAMSASGISKALYSRLPQGSRTITRSRRAQETVASMSHFAHIGPRAGGYASGERGWWYGSGGSGFALLSGTTVQRPGPVRRRGETTTTGRTLIISGGRKPVSKSQIRIWPRLGRKRIGIRGGSPSMQEALGCGAPFDRGILLVPAHAHQNKACCGRFARHSARSLLSGGSAGKARSRVLRCCLVRQCSSRGCSLGLKPGASPSQSAMITRVDKAERVGASVARRGLAPLEQAADGIALLVKHLSRRTLPMDPPRSLWARARSCGNWYSATSPGAGGESLSCSGKRRYEGGHFSGRGVKHEGASGPSRAW